MRVSVSGIPLTPLSNITETGPFKINKMLTLRLSTYMTFHYRCNLSGLLNTGLYSYFIHIWWRLKSSCGLDTIGFIHILSFIIQPVCWDLYKNETFVLTSVPNRSEVFSRFYFCSDQQTCNECLNKKMFFYSFIISH